MSVIDPVTKFLKKENQQEVKWLLAHANKWRTTTYKTEISRRRQYLDNEMEADGLDFLKKEFEKTYGDMENKMIEWPIVSHIVNKKAQVFRGVGSRFFLKDPTSGGEVDPEDPVAQSFDAMQKTSQIDTTLVDIDKAVEIMHAAAGKIGWDDDHLDVYCYDPDKTHIAVNGERENNPYSAHGVVFERTGLKGINDSPRYEVWGARDPQVAEDTDDQGRKIFHPTVHYIATEDGSVPVNDIDANPFKDRRTGIPMYPFTWFRDHKAAIYKRGGDDLVRFNRVLNLGLTYLNHNMHWQMAAIPVFEAQNADRNTLDKLKRILMSSPRHALQIPAGIKFYFVKPDVSIGPFLDAYEMLIQYFALLNQLSPKSIDVKGGLPQSGIALRIEFDNLIKYREERVKLLRPHVIDFLNRCIVVWNYYAPKMKQGYAKIPDTVAVDWDPGQMDAGPTDYIELGTRYEKEIEHNVSNVYEWCAAVHNIDIKTAEDRVRRNAEINAEFKRASTRYPEEPFFAERAVENLPIEEEEEEEEEAEE